MNAKEISGNPAPQQETSKLALLIDVENVSPLCRTTRYLLYISGKFWTRC